MRGEQTNRPSDRVQGAAAQRESQRSSRHGGMRAVGATASRVAAPIVARRGGGVLARLKAAWPEVVGAELASATWPEALGRDGALKLRVVSVAALDLQHRTPQVIERINLFLGHAAVSRLALVQGPLPLAAASKPLPPAALDGEEAAALDSRLAAVADPELRAALAGLGRLLLAEPRRR